MRRIPEKIDAMVRAGLVWRVIGLFGLLVIAAPSWATQQTGELVETQAEDARIQLLPIRPSDIPTRADEVRSNLRRIDALLQPSYEIEIIETAVDEEAATILELRGELDGVDPGSVSMRRLEDHAIEWSETRGKLDRWTAQLQERWEVLLDERAELSDTRVQWEATRRDVVEEGVSEELLQTIDAILEESRAAVSA